jgi:anti-sigma factor RsiW
MTAEHQLTAEELMEFLDGELAPAHAAIVQAHVMACESCRRLSAELRGISRDARRWDVGDVPEALAAPATPGRSRVSWLPPFEWISIRRVAVAGAGMGVLAVSLLYSVYNMVSTKPVQVTSQGPPQLELQRGAPLAAEQPATAVPGGPAIARVASLRITTADFDAARAGAERVVSSAGGWFRQLDVTAPRGQPRTMKAAILAPDARLDDVMSGLKALGSVLGESRQAEDVTDQVVDVRARLANARNTERRLADLLRTSTGKVADVLEAEREVSRVREEIERLDAQHQTLERRVAHATLNLEVREELKVTVDLGHRPVSTQFADAFQTGVKHGLEGVVTVGLLLLTIAPVLLIWGALFSLPLWLLWKWNRRKWPPSGAG